MPERPGMFELSLADGTVCWLPFVVFSRVCHALTAYESLNTSA